jgi:hypothetical protein
MKYTSIIIILITILICSCNSNKPLTRRNVYFNSVIIEGLEMLKGNHTIYKYYEERKKISKSYIVIEVKDSTILKTGNTLELNGFNNQINVFYVYIGEFGNQSSSNFKGKVNIIEMQNSKNITFNLDLISIDNKDLSINKIIKW